MIQRGILFFYLAVYMIAGHAQSSRETRLIQDFTKGLAEDVKKDNLHGGISIAVLKAGQFEWTGAEGNASLSEAVPVDTGTIFRIASISKMFTATVLMQLVEDGKVKLDDPLEKYVPEVSGIPGYSNQTKMTLLQLASHTSGLNREPEVAGHSRGPVSQWEDKLLSVLPHCSFNSRPGQQFLYSNVGFALLGLALERASGMPFTQLVQQRIFTPLHMDNTFYTVPTDKLGKLAPGIDNERDGAVNTKLPQEQVEGMGYRVPNGGIWSTPTDLAKFALALMSGFPGALITKEHVRQMLRVPDGGKNYGLGIMIMHDRQIDMIGHDGSDPGYTSQLTIEPRSGYIVILLRNYNK